MKTRQGWLESKEVVEVWYDPKVVSYEALLGFADDNECARQVWTRNEKQQAVALEKVGERSKSFKGAIRLDEEQKYYLLQTPLKELALSEAQASRVNASMDGNWKQFLSPIQRIQAQELLKLQEDVAAQEVTSRRSLQELAPSLPSSTLVEWLKDDDIRWNATAAGLELVKRSMQISRQKELISLLEPHLSSVDSQLRQVAIGILQRIGRVGVGAGPARKGANIYSPSAELMSASIQELNNYTTCRYPKWIRGSATQRDCVTYLLRVGPEHLKELVPMLHKAMDAKPKRERWIYAFILASIGSNDRFEPLTGLLIDQLSDNYIEEDALMCLNALYRMGERVIPVAEANLKTSTDTQQQASLRLLLLELQSDEANPPSSTRGIELNQLTWKCLNPIRSWRFGRDSH